MLIVLVIILLSFKEDSNIVGGAAGIHMTYTREGRPTGEGYLELGCEEDVERALTKHNEHLGPRYIEGMFGFPYTFRIVVVQMMT